MHYGFLTIKRAAACLGCEKKDVTGEGVGEWLQILEVALFRMQVYLLCALKKFNNSIHSQYDHSIMGNLIKSTYHAADRFRFFPIGFVLFHCVP